MIERIRGFAFTRVVKAVSERWKEWSNTGVGLQMSRVIYNAKDI